MTESLQALRELDGKRTKGRWRFVEDNDEFEITGPLTSAGAWLIARTVSRHSADRANAHFIVALENAYTNNELVPAEELSRLKAEVERYKRHEQTLYDNGIEGHTQAIARVHLAEAQLTTAQAKAWNEGREAAAQVVRKWSLPAGLFEGLHRELQLIAAEASSLTNPYGGGAECGFCFGKGYIEDTDDGVKVSGVYDCDQCNGTGRGQPSPDLSPATGGKVGITDTDTQTS